jgi:hypothetical protein
MSELNKCPLCGQMSDSSVVAAARAEGKTGVVAAGMTHVYVLFEDGPKLLRVSVYSTFDRAKTAFGMAVQKHGGKAPSEQQWKSKPLNLHTLTTDGIDIRLGHVLMDTMDGVN